MALVVYSAGQNLNSYVRMLSEIYGPTQNYAKSKYEIFSHLSEVCGIAAKYIAKKYDPIGAGRFLPKIFGWACALVSAMKPGNDNIEDCILRKFPKCCPYCLKERCECWDKTKPTINDSILKSLFYKSATSQRRSVNDFELMFTSIYGHSWIATDTSEGRLQAVVTAYLRLIEELAEVAEAVRFHHIYPENFNNEIADFIARWFALAFLLRGEQGSAALPLDQMLWRSYPSQCKDCQSSPCFCPQGPVREIMSKPSPGQVQDIDALTGLRNQGAYKGDLERVREGGLNLPLPITCIRIDVDKFKSVNDTYGHDTGDLALQHIANLIRVKSRPRDRLYRISGDEFGPMMPDASEEEGVGALRRIIGALGKSPASWVSPDMKSCDFTVSISAGVAECESATLIKEAFEAADRAAYRSKTDGRGRVSRASNVIAEGSDNQLSKGARQSGDDPRTSNNLD